MTKKVSKRFEREARRELKRLREQRKSERRGDHEFRFEGEDRSKVRAATDLFFRLAQAKGWKPMKKGFTIVVSQDISEREYDLLIDKVYDKYYDDGIMARHTKR